MNSTKITIDSLLEPFQRFGINLGLQRIEKLLQELDNPQKQVPIIHIAGTNGKGSVCAYLSSVLTEAGYKTGRFTSPHLIDWTERIYLNEQPITEITFIETLQQVIAKASLLKETPTQFEIITATAWLYFATEKVDIAIIEVGLGGRLDSTNVCHNPLVTAIVSISREHWQRLGPTIADITREKAGILKSNCCAIVGKLPPEAETVVKTRIKELNCPDIWVEPAIEINKISNSKNLNISRWAKYEDLEYPLPLLGNVQLMNSAIAIACLKVLQQKKWILSTETIIKGMAKTRWLGRLQWTKFKDTDILIDGAHNSAAAISLRSYVDTLGKSIIWVMGMLSTKDHEDIFQALLRPDDELHLVPVPSHSTAEPQELARLGQKVCPQLSRCETYQDLFLALERVIDRSSDKIIVFCGSLYLIGYFFKVSK